MPDNRARISTNNRVKIRLGTVVHGKAGKRRAIFPASVNNALTRATQAPRKMVARARESHTWAEIVRTRPRMHATTHTRGRASWVTHSCLAGAAAGVARLRNARVCVYARQSERADSELSRTRKRDGATLGDAGLVNNRAGTPTSKCRGGRNGTVWKIIIGRSVREVPVYSDVSAGHGDPDNWEVWRPACSLIERFAIRSCWHFAERVCGPWFELSYGCTGDPGLLIRASERFKCNCRNLLIGMVFTCSLTADEKYGFEIGQEVLAVKCA